MYKDLYKEEFARFLKERGLKLRNQKSEKEFWIIENGGNLIRSIYLINSDDIDPLLDGSKNGNELKSIGNFNFTLFDKNAEPKYVAFAFLLASSNFEFLVVRYEALFNRLRKTNSVLKNGKKINLVLWIFPDGFIFNATNISLEGEWYLLGGGSGRRMAEDSDYDYSKLQILKL